ncbi:MAG: hypothetical protein MJA83_06540 [Gammaproteobacteria bacterium]|nr:hypothetical protein [Gammaproteobacteria bacterium]
MDRAQLSNSFVFTTVAAVFIGFVTYAAVFWLSNDVIPAWVDQGAWVLKQNNPFLAVALWNIAVFIIAGTVVAIPAGKLLATAAPHSVMLSALPAGAVAVTVFLIQELSHPYRPYPWWYDTIRLVFLFSLLPVSAAAWSAMYRRR